MHSVFQVQSTPRLLSDSVISGPKSGLFLNVKMFWEEACLPIYIMLEVWATFHGLFPASFISINTDEPDAKEDSAIILSLCCAEEDLDMVGSQSFRQSKKEIQEHRERDGGLILPDF